MDNLNAAALAQERFAGRLDQALPHSSSKTTKEEPGLRPKAFPSTLHAPAPAHLTVMATPPLTPPEEWGAPGAAGPMFGDAMSLPGSVASTVELSRLDLSLSAGSRHGRRRSSATRMPPSPPGRHAWSGDVESSVSAASVGAIGHELDSSCDDEPFTTTPLSAGGSETRPWGAAAGKALSDVDGAGALEEQPRRAAAPCSAVVGFEPLAVPHQPYVTASIHAPHACVRWRAAADE